MVVMHGLDAVFLEERKRERHRRQHGTTGSCATLCRSTSKLTGDQTTIELDARKIDAIHVPGHSRAALVYVMSPRLDRVLFGSGCSWSHPSQAAFEQKGLYSITLIS